MVRKPISSGPRWFGRWFGPKRSWPSTLNTGTNTTVTAVERARRGLALEQRRAATRKPASLPSISPAWMPPDQQHRPAAARAAPASARRRPRRPAPPGRGPRVAPNRSQRPAAGTRAQARRTGDHLVVAAGAPKPLRSAAVQEIRHRRRAAGHRGADSQETDDNQGSHRGGTYPRRRRAVTAGGRVGPKGSTQNVVPAGGRRHSSRRRRRRRRTTAITTAAITAAAPKCSCQSTASIPGSCAGRA